MLHDDDDDDDDDEMMSINVSAPNEVKNKCFNIFPSIFRKQYFKYKTNCRLEKKHCNFGTLNDDIPNVPFPITDKCLTPGSPISPRVKNFNLDMKILVLSRNDNPYLSKQLERSNSLISSTTEFNDQECFGVDTHPPATPIFSRRSRISSRCSYPNSTQNRHAYSLSYEPEDQKNLHEQLIRSPPPNFPEKLSHFLFNESLISDQINFNRYN